MKKALLISDDLPEAESQENVQKIPCQSGHVDPERGGRSKSSGLTPQKHIKEQFIKKRGAAEYDEKSRLQKSYNVPLHLRIFDQCHGGFDMPWDNRVDKKTHINDVAPTVLTKPMPLTTCDGAAVIILWSQQMG